MTNKKFYTFYLITSVFSILWCFFGVKIFPECINTYLEISIFLIVSILTSLGTKVYKCCKKIEFEKKEEEFHSDMLNAVAILFNILLLLLFILNNKLSADDLKVISSLLTLIFIVYFFYKFLKSISISFIMGIIIFLLFLGLGLLDVNDISLLSLFFIVINSIMSVEERNYIVKFLKKIQIIRESNTILGLNEDELKGKYLSQKILIYIYNYDIYSFSCYTK